MYDINMISKIHALRRFSRQATEMDCRLFFVLDIVCGFLTGDFMDAFSVLFVFLVKPIFSLICEHSITKRNEWFRWLCRLIFLYFMD